MTNQQAVVNAGTEISRLMEVYNACLRKIFQEHRQNNTAPSLDELLEIQEKGVRLFNYAETFVGQSGLLGAHKNGLWVTGFAETCYAVLEIVVQNYSFLARYKHIFKGSLQKPTIHAYANMQRMVKKYLPKEQNLTLYDKFVNARLRTYGFESEGASDTSPTEATPVVNNNVIHANNIGNIQLGGEGNSIVNTAKIETPQNDQEHSTHWWKNILQGVLGNAFWWLILMLIPALFAIFFQDIKQLFIDKTIMHL